MIFQDTPFIERFDITAEFDIDAVEFWEWRSKDLTSVQAALLDNELDLIGMAGLGVNDPDLTDPESNREAIKRVEESIEIASEIGCPNLIVLVGDRYPEEPRRYQHNRIIDGLQELAPTAESAGISLLIEPLNTAVDHPNYFLETAADGFEIVNSVNSSNVQLLYDIYHQQITEGDIITTLTEEVQNVGHIHIADVPGRHEPGTGELNYSNIISAVEEAGYNGYFGFEFQPLFSPAAAIETVVNL